MLNTKFNQVFITCIAQCNSCTEEYFTTAQKWQCLGMLPSRDSQNHVARLFGKSKSVIARFAALQSQTDDVKMRWGRGCHRIGQNLTFQETSHPLNIFGMF